MKDLKQVPEYIPNSCYGCMHNELEKCNPIENKCKKGFIWIKGKAKVKDFFKEFISNVSKNDCVNKYPLPKVFCEHDCKTCWEDALKALDCYEQYLKPKKEKT